MQIFKFGKRNKNNAWVPGWRLVIQKKEPGLVLHTPWFGLHFYRFAFGILLDANKNRRQSEEFYLSLLHKSYTDRTLPIASGNHKWPVCSSDPERPDTGKHNDCFDLIPFDSLLSGPLSMRTQRARSYGIGEGKLIDPEPEDYIKPKPVL
jgi:hypothetical protein